MSDLQLGLYQHLLNSRLVKSCLHYHTQLSGSGHQTIPPHLLCIAALKKLCNCPSLVYKTAVERGSGEEEHEGTEEEEVNGIIWATLIN